MVGNSRKIIFFDGVCGLCNGFVDFILKIDSKSVFKFSPLQSEFASLSLRPEFVRDLDSVVALIDDVPYRKSRAVLKIMESLGGPWRLISYLSILPQGFTDFCYDLVAKNRYNLFGKRSNCRLPSPEERERFIL